ncbi:NAD(P)-binding protein [Mesorhizobium sp. M0578]|uniref:NAD(P)-binding protein n=1 Tax=unclassified Mesorhizobium TaxID=325217 RepID=UPI003337B955
MSEVLDALVIGAGPAGLGVSYFLKRQDRDHRVLDRGRIGAVELVSTEFADHSLHLTR